MRTAIFTTLFLFSFVNTLAQDIESVACKRTELDSFDIEISYRLVNNQLDTVSRKLKKTYSAFEPCRVNTYQAIYTDRKGVELSNEQIITLATGNRWEHQPNIQNELLINYEIHDKNERDRLKELSINKTYSGTWKENVIEGVIENEERIWMHPFRSNQYIFTEVAPFPEIQLPIQIGKKWSSEIQITEGWGVWNQTNWRHKYKIVGSTSRNYPFGFLDNCIKVTAVSSNKRFSKCKLDLWYHENYGFIELNYKNYKGQQLSIVLQKTEMKADNIR